MPTIDHDRLFKELVVTFFAQFIELFFPQIAAEIDRDEFEFLDKEIFTDVGSGGRREVDLLAKVRLRGGEAFVLIHIENQSSAESDFPLRMFRYYSRIESKFNLPVYPIAIFSYDRPVTPAVDTLGRTLFGHEVLKFWFDTIQLNRLDWRKYLSTPNPVAGALMAKMRIAPEDRPKVKAQCVRMIATLRLDPARTALIAAFMNTYLKLTKEEMAVYNREMQIAAPTDKTFILEIENEWTEMGEAKGEAKGEIRGQARIVTRQLQRRFGDLSAELAAGIGRLTPERIDEFADALLDFKSMADAEAWVGISR